MNTVCFTGHRPNKFKFNEHPENFEHFKAVLKKTIADHIERGYLTFYTGMAEGFDIWAAEAVLSLRDSYDGIKLYAVVPYPKQSHSYSQDMKERYERILKSADEVITTSAERTKDCFKLRNYYMVDHSDAVIGACNLNAVRSGSVQTIRYAVNKELKVTNIDPTTYELITI